MLPPTTLLLFDAVAAVAAIAAIAVAAADDHTTTAAAAAAAGTTAATATADDPWPSVPACSPPWPRAAAGVTPDDRGHLWGRDTQGRSCAFKDAQTGTPLALEAWERDYACGDAPSAGGTKRDKQGRLWGWDAARGRSCAYKDQATGRPRLYDGYAPGCWLETPACGKEGGREEEEEEEEEQDRRPLEERDPLAVQDGWFRTWSWEVKEDGEGERRDDGSNNSSTPGVSPQLCAYKDDRQAPIPPDPQDYTRLSFLDAPACRGGEGGASGEGGGKEVEGPTPANARPDREGFLWGWENVRPCAWKREDEGQQGAGRAPALPTPLFYAGYDRGPATAKRERRTVRGVKSGSN